MSSPIAFTLRPAELRDVAPIVALIRELAEFEKLTHLLQVTPEKLRPHLFGEKPVAEALVGELAAEGLAEGESPIVAFALFFTNFSTFLARPGLYLEDLFVEPEHRGAGIGRDLLQKLAAIAVERECGRLEWAVLDWNEPAIRFYERLGAKPNADWTVYRLTGESLRALAGQ